MSAETAAPAPVTVIGVDFDRLSDAAAAALRTATLVVGAERHLSALPVPPDAEQIVLDSLDPAIERLLRHTGDAAVLASGDPGFFGIVRLLIERGVRVRVVPAVSSVAAAFAAAGLPWDASAVVSAHGRDCRYAVNACRAMPRVAVLTSPGAGPAELGRGLVGWPRRLVVAERLGMPDQRVVEVTPAEAAELAWAEPNVALSLSTRPATGTRVFDNQPAAAPHRGWALAESAYQHRSGMITKAEVRAYAVAMLAPRLGRLVWDIGAGSGSVGIECAGLGAAVIAVERDERACRAIRANAETHGVDLLVVPQAAVEAIAGLPAADAAFLGGGGLDALAAVVAHPSNPARVVASFAAIDRVAPAMSMLRERGYAVDGVQLAASRLTDLPGGSVRLSAANPVVVVTGVLP